MNKPASLDQIAESLVNTEAQSLDDDAIVEKILKSPTVGEDDDLPPEDEEEQDDAADDEDDSEEDDDAEPGDDAEEDEEEASDDADTDQYLDVKDEDLIRVKIDGKWEVRTIADAKKALSGEGAIEKRLKEVTDKRNEVTRTLQKSHEDAATQVNILRTAVNHMGDALFKPMMNPPDENLLNTNPTLYQKQELAYRKELSRVNGLRQQFGQVFQVLNTKLQEDQKEIRNREKQTLADKLPVLTDPEMGPKRRKAIIDAATHYGFSAEEIGLASDHRLFLMAHDAAMYRLSQKKANVKELKEAKPNKPRVLRSGHTTAKMKAQQTQKQRDTIKQRAKQTGSVDDVALMLLKPARRRR